MKMKYVSGSRLLVGYAYVGYPLVAVAAQLVVAAAGAARS